MSFSGDLASAAAARRLNSLLRLFLLNSRAKTNADRRIPHSFDVTVIVAVLLDGEPPQKTFIYQGQQCVLFCRS